MKKLVIIFVSLILSHTVNGQDSFKDNDQNTMASKELIFGVPKANQSIIVDGKLDELDWKKSEVRSFDYFYHVEKLSDKQNTSLRMLWDQENLYVFFQCEDKYLTAREKDRDAKPYFDDCAEIFLIPAADSLKMHLGFEVNLYKASNDFVFLNDFKDGKNALVKAFNPDFEVEVTYDGTLNDNSDIDIGWTMEMAIPLKLFNGLDSFSPAIEGNRWAFSAIRQERNELDGNRRSTSTIFPDCQDVHDPGRFGLLEFTD